MSARIEPSEMHKASRPRKGQTVSYRGQVVGVVDHVDGSLCWVRYHDSKKETLPFIWCFSEGLNKLHDWPTKAGEP
jgi:hypothetical protein